MYKVALLSLDFSHLSPGLDPVWWHLSPGTHSVRLPTETASMGRGAEHRPQARWGGWEASDTL